MSSIDEPVHVVSYNQSWPLAFAAERERLCAALRVFAAQIEHIGSTAVPGLASKSIIDIMLGVEAYPPSEGLIEDIVRIGYESLGEAGVCERLYFRCRAAVNFNLHVVCRSGTHWVSNLALRKYLRSHVEARTKYAEVKQSAIASGATHLLAYSEAKSQALSDLLQKALAYHHDG